MNRLTFEGDRHDFESPAICCCCSTAVEPKNPRQSHAIEVGTTAGEPEAQVPVVVAACEPCQFHWTETSKEARIGAALFGLIVLAVAIGFWKGRYGLLAGCLGVVVLTAIMGVIVHFVFRQKLDPGCHSGPSGPVEAKKTAEGKLVMTFWNPKFAREFGRLNGASDEELKGIPDAGST